MLYNIHFLPDNISVAGPSVLPSGNHTSGQTYTLDTHQKNKKFTQDVGLKYAARKCWKCEKEGCGGRIRMDQCTNASGSCGSKECKGKDSRHPSYPCKFLLRAQNAEKSTYFYFSPSEVLWKSGIAINMFCGDFLKFLPIESVLVSHEIPPFLILGNFLCFPLYSHNHGNQATTMPPNHPFHCCTLPIVHQSIKATKLPALQWPMQRLGPCI